MLPSLLYLFYTIPIGSRRNTAHTRPDDSKKGFPKQQELLFWVIINILSERLSQEDTITSSSQSWYISNIIKYMSENLSENLTLDSIAEHFHISRAKLAKDFKSSTDQTIHQLLIYMRISRAAYIIRSGKYKNIQDVADQVGMGNSYNFYQVFKKLRKVTPYQYIQRCKITKKGMPVRNY